MTTADMTDLSALARRWSLPFDCGSINLPHGRVTSTPDGDLAFVGSDVAPALARKIKSLGVTLYQANGALTVAFSARRFGELVEIERPAPEEPMPSYGRTGGYRS